MQFNKANSKTVIALLSVIMAAGLWLTLSAPGRIAGKSLTSAEMMAAEGASAAAAVESEFNGVSGWYKPEYCAPASSLIAKSRNSLAEADAGIKKAQKAGSSKEKRSEAEKAKKCVVEAQGSIRQAKESLAAIRKLADESRQLLSKATADIRAVNLSYSSAAERLASEGGAYLKKYSMKNAEALSQARVGLGNAGVDLEKARALLPDQGSASRSGDPKQAMSLLAVAQQSIESLSASIRGVSADLDFCKAAETKAAGSVADAKKAVQAANSRLEGIIGAGQLSADKALKKPFSDAAQAGQLLTAASTALVTAVENGKFDLPSAYADSLKAIGLADGAVKEADRQLALAAQVKTLSGSLDNSIAGFGAQIEQARPYQAKLNRHASPTWTQVAGSLESATADRASARDSLAKARLAASESQVFETALSQLQKGAAALEKGAASLQGLIATAQNLESYRTSWPAEESRAQSMINENESEVDSYGSHSSSAQSDFESAKDYLAKARREAGDRYFESAVRDAREACRLADGTGATARRAYDSYQDSLNTSSSSSPIDFGSSGSDSSSSSSYDYSGSSSSYDYSGGSSSYDSGSSSSLDGGGYSGDSGSDGNF